MKIPVKPLFIMALIPILIIAGCGGSAEETLQAAVDGVTVDTLLFADTVGVLMGDSCYEFGTLDAIMPVPEGIAILDGVFCRICIYNGNGEFLYSQGRCGSGPGEYSNPFSMCRLYSGEYLVFDLGAKRMTLLDLSMNYISEINTTMNLPLRIAPGTDSMVVIKEIVSEFTDEQLMAGYRIYSMNAYTGNEGIVYREKQLVMGTDEVDLKPYYSFFTTDNEGNVYLADYDSDEYGFDIVSSEGELQRTIVIEFAPREKFDPEIHALIYLPLTVPFTTESGTSVLRVTYPNLQPYISDLAIDDGNNIWVRRQGVADSETWDVVSQDGDLLRRVVLYADTTGTGAYPELHVSQFGILATFRNEYEYERFFTLKYANN